MVRESQTPRVTQIQVRVDCNGCVQKIKRALNGINGIHDLRVDFSRQRLTIIGWADPEKVVKAIKKTRKNATICSNIELASSSKPTQPEPKGNAPAPDSATTTTTQPQPAEAPPAQAGPSSEPSPEATPSPTPTQHNAIQQWQNNPGTTPSSTPTKHNANQQWQNNPGTKDVGQVHMIHHHQPNYVNRFSSGHSCVDQRDRYHDSPEFLQEPSQSMHVTHSYNTHMPSSYVTEYEHVISPSSWHTHYNRMEHYSEDFQNGNVNIASMFSDDNPNACSIV